MDYATSRSQTAKSRNDHTTRTEQSKRKKVIVKNADVCVLKSPSNTSPTNTISGTNATVTDAGDAISKLKSNRKEKVNAGTVTRARGR